MRSTALLFGRYIRPALTVFGINFVALLALAGYMNGHGLPFFSISVGGTLLHLFWQYATVDLDKPTSCHRESLFFSPLSIAAHASWPVNFVRNGQLGWIVWGGLVLDYTDAMTSGVFSAFPVVF